MHLGSVRCFLMFFVFYMGSTVTPFTKPNGDLTSHILQLEQTVADLQAKSRIQEQKQVAVLSSVLSKLTTTTHELSKVQADIRALETEHNNTLTEFQRHRDDSRSMKIQLEENTKSLKTLEVITNTHVGFQVKLTKDTDVQDKDVLRFDQIRYNAGGGYNSTSGVFVAPISGSYVFWCHVRNGNNTPMTIFLWFKGYGIGRAIAFRVSDVASITTVGDVQKGERIWLTKHVVP